MALLGSTSIPAQSKPKSHSVITGHNPTVVSQKQAWTGQPQQLARCVRWPAFSQNLTRTSGGRGGIWIAFNELPEGFKQGCIFFEDNNSLDIAYVLKDGIEPSAVLTNGQFYEYYGGVPAFGSGVRGTESPERGMRSREELEKLRQQGQALLITWLTPTNGSIPYLNSIPKNRAFVRNDEMVCFSTVCMGSRAVSNEELARILEEGRKFNTAKSLLFSSQWGVSEQLSEQTIQSLPDGVYLYGETSYPNRVGTRYIVFYKSGNVLIGSSYKRNTDDSYCFRGTVNLNLLTNATFAYESVPDRSRPLTNSFSTGQSLDLSQFYRVNGVDNQVTAERSISRCNQIFSNRQN